MTQPEIAKAIEDANKILGTVRMKSCDLMPVWHKLDRTIKYLNKTADELLAPTLKGVGAAAEEIGWLTIVAELISRGYTATLEGGGAGVPYIQIDAPNGCRVLLGNNGNGEWVAECWDDPADVDAGIDSDYSAKLNLKTIVPANVIADRLEYCVSMWGAKPPIEEAAEERTRIGTTPDEEENSEDPIECMYAEAFAGQTDNDRAKVAHTGAVEHAADCACDSCIKHHLAQVLRSRIDNRIQEASDAE